MTDTLPSRALGRMLRRLHSAAGTLFVFASLFGSLVARADDWHSFIGGTSDRRSLSRELGPSAPTVFWQGGPPAELPGHPVIEGNRVISSRTEQLSQNVTTTWIVAQNLTTGSLLWRVQLPVSFSDSWHSQVVGIHGGQVYASRASNGANAEYLYALDAQDGEVIWRSEELVDQASNAQSVVFAANGDVIHGNFLSLVRIRRSDGGTVWSTPRLCPTSNGCGAAVAGNRVYAWEDVDTPSGLQLSITAYDVDTGTKLYSSAPLLQGFFTINQITPLVGPGGIVYAPLAANTPGDAFIALRDTGVALPEIWRIPMGFTPFASFGVGPDGSVYTYSRNNELLRLDPDTGAVRNTSIQIPHDAAAFQPHLLIDSAGRVFLSNGGVNVAFLYSFNPDLTLRWQEAIPVVSAPALGSNGTLVVCGSGTDVRAYRSVSPWNFYTVTPCRVADTRGAAGPLGGPALAAGTERSFPVAGACSIPGTARAASINVTVTGPTAQGHLTLFPDGAPVPATSTINYRTGQTRANNAVVSLGSDGRLIVRSAQPQGSVQVVIDVNGYFQ